MAPTPPFFPALPAPVIWVLALLAFFHTSEFLLAAAFNRNQLSRRSWLFSAPYCAAMALGFAEYALEARYFPALKAPVWPARLGVGAALAGEALRKAGILTARAAFTHQVQFARRREHALVTRGVYGAVRHPGYAGWLLWAVGTQVALANPACAAGFAAAAWAFFARRVEVEEALLLRFFGEEYARYRRRVPSGLPFIP